MWTVFRDPALRALVDEAIRAATTSGRRGARRARPATRSPWRVPTCCRRWPIRARRPPARQRAKPPQNLTFNSFLALNLAWEDRPLGAASGALTEAARRRYLAAEATRRGVLLTLVSDVAQATSSCWSSTASSKITHSTTITFQDTVDLFRRPLRGRHRHVCSKCRARRRAHPGARRHPGDRAPDRRPRENQSPSCSAAARFRHARRAARRRGAGAECRRGAVQLLERRPDIQQAEQALVARTPRSASPWRASSRASASPACTAARAGELENVVKSAGNVWGHRGSLAGAALPGGTAARHLPGQLGRLQEAVERYQQATLRAFAEVSDALVAQEKLAGVRTDARRRRRRCRRRSRSRCSATTTASPNYFEVLEAEQQLFPAELDRRARSATSWWPW